MTVQTPATCRSCDPGLDDRFRLVTRVLFVRLGNICRSPTAEGVFRALVAEVGLDDEIVIDSAGTGGWHIGAPPDARATHAAALRGITLTGAARQVTMSDFEEFDLLIAMDRENLRALRAMAPDDEARAKIRLLRDDGGDVPDPYYGGEDGFDEVLDLVTEGGRRLLDEEPGADAIARSQETDEEMEDATCLATESIHEGPGEQCW